MGDTLAQWRIGDERKYRMLKNGKVQAQTDAGQWKDVKQMKRNNRSLEIVQDEIGKIAEKLGYSCVIREI